jgi:hypothetical protein
MHSSKSSLVLILISFIVLGGLVTGCGGGGQSGNGSQDGGPAGTKERGGQQAAKKDRAQEKIALGTVKRVRAERRVVILKPNTGEEAKKPRAFKITEKATLSMGEKKADLADIREGQQAQITYVVVNERNRAREVTLFGGGEAPPESGEKTG